MSKADGLTQARNVQNPANTPKAFLASQPSAIDSIAQTGNSVNVAENDFYSGLAEKISTPKMDSKTAEPPENLGGFENAEVFDDGSQRDAGLGTEGQAGSVAESTSRSVAASQARTEAAILGNLKKNAAAQSARSIGVENGSEDASLYVLSDEDIAQSEQWQKIKSDAEADGARTVLFVGDLKVYNPTTKQYSKVEGIYQTDGNGNTTYYIKADKISRPAQKIYLHEKFHNIVNNNPQILSNLVQALEDQYGKQEIAALLSSYIEAYGGIYGRFSDSMTEKEKKALAMKYWGEVFADVYAGIHRGRANTAKAKQIMDSQTTELQRTAQNRKAMKNKNAPPGQQYSLSPTKRGKLEKEIDRLGEERIAIFAGEKRIVVLTDDFTKDKAIYSQKGRTKKEVNARIKAIPEFGSIIRRSKFERTDTDVRNLESKAKKGVIAMQHFSTKHDGFDVDIVIRDKGKTQFLYEVKFIEHKKSPKQSMPDKSDSTAPKGDVWDADMVSDNDPKVKQEFSVEGDKARLEDRVQGDDYLNAMDLIDEITAVGAEVDENGYVTVYHRTNDAAATVIRKTGVMQAKEDGLFFSTNPDGSNNYGYGDSVITLKVPAEKLVLDDIFDDEASVKIPLENRRRMNVSEYIVSQQDSSQQYSFEDDVVEQSSTISTTDIGALRRIGRKSVNDFTSQEIQATERWARKFYSELGTKSPFFRAWFGDWRGYDTKTKLNYIPVNSDFTALTDIERGIYDNRDTGWQINVSRGGIEETANKKGKYSEEYRALKDISAMIQNAVLLDTIVASNPSKNMGKDAAFVHHLYCPVETSTGKSIAKLYISESFEGKHKFYLTKIERVSSDRSFLYRSEESTLGAFDTSDDTEISVAEIFNFVKENDIAYEKDSKRPVFFSPKPVNPVLLNEDGMPKVFYHGTGERFTEFSDDEMSPVEGSFFFAENREDAQAYGKNVMAVYLAGNNLANYDDQPSEFYRLRNKREQVQWLKERGYDGWYADMDSEGWGEVSVFSQGQIKSATDNVGTFNAGNADIRYSFDDEVAELDEGYAQHMAEDDTPEGLAPDDDQITDYHALAKAEKERRAKHATANSLKNRIKSSEKAIAAQREAKTALKNIGGLTKEVKEQLDQKIKLIQETLQIDRAALKEKQAVEEKHRKQERKEKEQAEIQGQKAKTAQKELRQDLLNLFSVKPGVRMEVAQVIDAFSDELVRSGTLTNEHRRALFETLYEYGEEFIEADEYHSDIRKALQQGRIYVSEGVRAEFGDDWESFRKRAWGNRIYLTSNQNDMGIDSWTESLRGAYGGSFDGNNDLKTQLEIIIELAEEGRGENVTIAEMMRRNQDD